MAPDLLKADIEMVMKILERAFELADKPKNTKERVKVFLTRLDFDREGARIGIEDFVTTLCHLKANVGLGEMDFSNVDFVNGDDSLYENPDPYPSLVDLVLPSDFPKIAGQIRNNLHLEGAKIRRHTSVVSGDILSNLEPETQIGDLIGYNDGTIRFKGEIMDMRPRVKDLCRIFMKNPLKLITIDTIREEIVDQKKRKITPNATISKYVSELHKILGEYFKKKVIFNQRKEGWIFKP